MGDVSGKGAEAAAVTALARYTLRTAAARLRSPAGDPALGGRGDARPGRHRRALLHDRLRARRPRALARAADRVLRRAPAARAAPRGRRRSSRSASPGTLLGLIADPELQDSSTELRPGDTLVLYTDGLTEARAPAPTWGFEELAAAVRAAPRDGPEGLVTSLVASALGDRAAAARRPRGARAQAGRPAAVVALGLPVACGVVVVVLFVRARSRLPAAACPRQAYHRPQAAALLDIRYPILWSPFPVPTHDRGCRKPGA